MSGEGSLEVDGNKSCLALNKKKEGKYGGYKGSMGNDILGRWLRLGKRSVLNRRREGSTESFCGLVPDPRLQSAHSGYKRYIVPGQLTVWHCNNCRRTARTRHQKGKVANGPGLAILLQDCNVCPAYS